MSKQLSVLKQSQIIETQVTEELRELNVSAAGVYMTALMVDRGPLTVYLFSDNDSIERFKAIYLIRELCSPLFTSYYRSEGMRVEFRERNSRRTFSFGDMTDVKACFYLLSFRGKFEDTRFPLYEDIAMFDFSSRVGAMIDRPHRSKGGTKPLEVILNLLSRVSRGEELRDQSWPRFSRIVGRWMKETLSDGVRIKKDYVRKMRRSPFSFKLFMGIDSYNRKVGRDLQHIGEAINIAYLAIQEFESVSCCSYFDSKKYYDIYLVDEDENLTQTSVEPPDRAIYVFSFPDYPLFTKFFGESAYLEKFHKPYRLTVSLLFTVVFLRVFKYDLSDVEIDDLMMCKGNVLLPRYEMLMYTKTNQMRHRKNKVFTRSRMGEASLKGLVNGVLTSPEYDLSIYAKALGLSAQDVTHSNGSLVMSSHQLDKWYGSIYDATTMAFDKLPEDGKLFDGTRLTPARLSTIARNKLEILI